MLAMHCGGCWETPCVCPKHSRIPNDYDLSLLTVTELTDLSERVKKQLFLKTRTVTVSNTSGARMVNPIGTCSSVQESLYPVITPEEQ